MCGFHENFLLGYLYAFVARHLYQIFLTGEICSGPRILVAQFSRRLAYSTS